MKIILCGYNWAGCKALQLLLDLKHELFVYTHEGPWHVPSLIDYCKEKDVAFSTENISDSELPFKPDVICSIYYRYIIKENIIDSCNHRIFNIEGVVA
jgi:UDP-4-amino-4-deoxy-L-arabinose formyltransferase/UDP-glucuronic acid dehydrogenase (UDP-4-keto-hexauronic acid decarboxylating)